MKTKLSLIAVALLLAGCGSHDQYDNTTNGTPDDSATARTADNAYTTGADTANPPPEPGTATDVDNGNIATAYNTPDSTDNDFNASATTTEADHSNNSAMDTETATMPADLAKASSLIGKEVKNLQDESLGHIDNLAVDSQSGKVAYAVLSTGGVLGVGEKFVAVPLTALSTSATDKNLVMSASKASIEAAPGFDKDHWPNQANPAWGAQPATPAPSAQPSDKFEPGVKSDTNPQTLPEPNADRNLDQNNQTSASDREKQEHLTSSSTGPSYGDLKPEAAATSSDSSPSNNQPDQLASSDRSSSDSHAETAELQSKESVTIPLRSETLAVKTKEVPAGGVVIHTTVESKEVSKPVELRHEKIVVEHLTPDQVKSRQTQSLASSDAGQSGSIQGLNTSTNNAGFKDREIFIPLTKEVPVVTKETNVTDVVRIAKQEISDQKNVTGTVHKESIQINQQNGSTQPALSSEESAPDQGIGTQKASQTGERSMTDSQSESSSATVAGSLNTGLAQKVQTTLSSKSDDSKGLLNGEQMKQVHVSARGAVVMLTGSVKSQDLKREITRRVQMIPGVQSVDNQLKVNNQ